MRSVWLRTIVSSSIGLSKDGYVTLQKMADKLIELGGQIPEGVTSVKVSKKADAQQPPAQSAAQGSDGAQGDAKNDGSPETDQNLRKMTEYPPFSVNHHLERVQPRHPPRPMP